LAGRYRIAGYLTAWCRSLYLQQLHAGLAAVGGGLNRGVSIASSARLCGAESRVARMAADEERDRYRWAKEVLWLIANDNESAWSWADCSVFLDRQYNWKRCSEPMTVYNNTLQRTRGVCHASCKSKSRASRVLAAELNRYSLVGGRKLLSL
jgi:hypothetical protein